MKIIVVEGLDKAGKHTVSKGLASFIKKRGFKVEQSEFHRYDTPTGALIMDWLTGEWDVSQETIELIMSADKQAQQQYFEELRESGIDYLILDRYTTSQKVYGLASGMDKSWIMALQKNLYRPHMELYIDISPETSMKRKGKHNNGENDRYESDRALLTRVRRHYMNHYYDYDNVYRIDGEQAKAKVLEDVLRTFSYFEKIK